jgi:hypothetical protein
MFPSKKILMSGIAIAALAAPALAEDRSTEKQKEQYLYQQGQEQNLGGANSQGAIGATHPRSGPGVQGPPDTRTGPSTRAPGDDNAASTGASAGTSGDDSMNTSKPSQDSSGVQGFPDTRTGPSTRSPEDGTKGAGSSQ